MEPPALEHDDYTVGWICALPKEMTAARGMLHKIHPDLPLPLGDHNFYYLGSIGVHNIAIACLPLGEIGTNSAATVATRMLTTFKSIRFGLMVGIGGGVPGKRHAIQLGDVVVSMPTGQNGGVVQWDFGKSTKSGGFERTGSLNRPPDVLMTALAKLKSTHDMEDSKISAYVADMVARYPKLSKYTLQPGMKDILFEAEYDHVDNNETCDDCEPSRSISRLPRDIPVVHYGVIASGNQVIKDGIKRDKINKDLGGVLCFEMEAAGLLNHFQCVVIRGICDYADSHKNKDWQEYAAATAAAFAKELLTVIPGNEVANTRTVKEAISEAGKSVLLIFIASLGLQRTFSTSKSPSQALKCRTVALLRQADFGRAVPSSRGVHLTMTTDSALLCIDIHLCILDSPARGMVPFSLCTCNQMSIVARPN